jgi:hypothetical protein
MKRIFLLFALLLFVFTLIAQVPLAFKYQAVARDASGNVLANKSVTFKINILQGSITGLNIYNELHAVTTNAFGLVELNIGQGTSPSSVFANINWGTSTYFIKVELDPLGGVTFYHMGTSQLLSVPYALLARSVQDIPDNIVTNSKIASNAVTINKLPAGATATTFLRGDGTWQTPVSSGGNPFGANGSIQYYKDGAFGASQTFHYDYANNRLGLGTNSPDSKFEIVAASTSGFPHMKLTQANSDYGRIYFQNSTNPSYWSLGGLNSSTNTSERFKISNSVSGDAVTISGDGKVGINADPGPVSSRLYLIEDISNRYSIYTTNTGTYPTIYAKNNGTGSAGYFYNNGTTYTLYAQNLGTGPALYLDGGLQVAGGNTAEINRNQTGTANIVPISYGNVSSSGIKNTGASTANFSVSKIGTGVYDITITDETYSATTHTAIASLGDPGFINTIANAGKLRVYTYSNTGVLSDREFSFVIYKP